MLNCLISRAGDSHPLNHCHACEGRHLFSFRLVDSRLRENDNQGVGHRFDRPPRVWYVVFFLLFLAACQPISNYDTEATPFVGAYATATSTNSPDLRLVTWNIQYGEDAEEAATVLLENENLRGADVLLLQEMDETAVSQIARSLQYNYVYYPASIHRHHDKNFGNAILSAWPLSQPAKLILPHENPKNGQTRIAVRAVADIDGVPALVYSTHTETIWLSEAKRTEQVAAITDDIAANGDDYAIIIVGGDFNSVTAVSIENITAQFEAVGLERVSAGASPTVIVGGIEFTADHLFAKGITLIENGVETEIEVSDHFPVWVQGERE